MLLPLRFITALPYAATIILFKDDLAFKNYVKWFWLYCVFSISLYCLETTAGIPFTLSLLPLCCCGLYNYYRQSSKKKFLLNAFTAITVLTVFFIIFRDFFLHNFEFVLNVTKYNTPAFGHQGYSNFQDLARSRFLFIFQFAYKSPVYFLFPAFIFLFIKEIKNRRTNAALFIAAMAIFLTVSISYALVRFDLGDMLRAHKIAMCFIYLLFPAFLYFNRARYKRLLNFYVLFMLLLLVFQIGFKFRYHSTDYVSYYWTEPSFGLNVQTLKDRFSLQKHQIEENDFFRQGHSRLSEDELGILQSAEDFFEAEGLQDKTFFDLTNRSVNYYYFKKIPPFTFWAYNNIIDPEADFQYAKQMSSSLPDCVLIFSNNSGIWDNLLPGIKVNSVYRTLLLSGKYELKTYGGSFYLVKSSSGGFSQNDITILDAALGTQILFSLPDAWGMSLKKLKGRLNELYPHFQTALQENVLYIEFEKPIPAKTLDLISIERKCDSNYAIFANGRFIVRGFRNKETSLVPLDVIPSYLLSGEIKNIAIAFSKDEPSLRKIKVKFYQRTRNIELNNLRQGDVVFDTRSE
jgi:hypothetical protein